MSQQDNIAATERLGAAVNSGNLDALNEVFAPNVIDRDPASDQEPGPEATVYTQVHPERFSIQ
jgi:hypothetical protein